MLVTHPEPFRRAPRAARRSRSTRKVEAQAAHDLASRDTCSRLWTCKRRALGLYQARDAAQMQAILEALPLAPWMTMDTTPLSPHPSDPANVYRRTRRRREHRERSGPEGSPVSPAWARRGLGLPPARLERCDVTARTGIKQAEDPDVLTVNGDLANSVTAGRIVSGALGRSGRIDTLVATRGRLRQARNPSRGDSGRTGEWPVANDQ